MYHSGLLLIYPGTLTDIVGIVLVGLVITWQFLRVGGADKKLDSRGR